MEKLIFLYVLKVVICDGGYIKSGTTSMQGYTTELDDHAAAKSTEIEEFLTRDIDLRHQVHVPRHLHKNLSRNVKVQGRTIRRRQARQLAQARVWKQAENPCMQWKPTLNTTVTGTGKTRSLLVDYCHSGGPYMVSTHTCLVKGMRCEIINEPACSHMFDNVSTGNTTVWVQALCTNCYDNPYNNVECPTIIYTEDVVIEPPAVELDNRSVTREDHLHRAIIFASCGAIFTIGLITCMATHCKKKDPPTVIVNNKNQQHIACSQRTCQPRGSSHPCQETVQVHEGAETVILLLDPTEELTHSGEPLMRYTTGSRETGCTTVSTVEATATEQGDTADESSNLHARRLSSESDHQHARGPSSESGHQHAMRVSSESDHQHAKRSSSESDHQHARGPSSESGHQYILKAYFQEFNNVMSRLPDFAYLPEIPETMIVDIPCHLLHQSPQKCCPNTNTR